MIKKFSEEASINNLGSVQYDRPQKYMTQKDKDQAWENLGMNSGIIKDMEEMLYTNLPIAEKTIRFNFSNEGFDPTTDPVISGKSLAGTWKYIPSKYNNIWEYSENSTTFASRFFISGTQGVFMDEDNLVNVLKVDFTGVSDLSRLFAWCTAIYKVYDFSIDSTIEGGVNTFLVFNHNERLIEVPKKLDFSNSNNLQALFQNCESLEYIDTLLLPTTGNLSFANAFLGCFRLKEFKTPLDFSAINNMSNIFCSCLSLEKVNIINYNKVTNYNSSQAQMPSCTAFANMTSAVSNATMAYAGEAGAPGYNYTRNDITAMPAGDYTGVISANKMFYQTNLKSIDELNMPKVNSVSAMFKNCEYVEAGMLRAYTYLKSCSALSAAASGKYAECFANCGTKSEAGMIERKYIPVSWGGDLEE